MLKINALLILLFSIQNLQAANSLSYSGRLVQVSGAPVTGPVNLRAELVYTNATSTVLCSQNLSSVALTKGVFHLKLDLNCTPKTMNQVLAETPNGESVAIRIIDQTNSKSYPLQAIHSVPFSKVAEQLPQMGASSGQALAWDGSKWAPTSVGTGNGTVMSVTAGTGLSGGTITTTGTIGIAAGGIGTTELANNSVTAAKINAGEITSSHISATANIPYSKLSIGAGEIPQDRINGLATSMSALIEDVIADAVTGKAPSQNAVYDALNLKADRSNVAQNITAASVTGLTGPLVGSDAANKTYVDNSATTLDTRITNEASTLNTRITNEVTTLNTSLGNKYDKAGGVITGDVTLNTQLLLKGGANFVTLKANSGTANYVMTLPTSAGTNGYVLQTDGAGVLSWVNPSSVTTGTGTVNSASITDGSIVDADINASANIAQSKIAGLTTSLSGKENTITAGTTAQYYRGDKTFVDLGTDVRGTNLTGYTVGTNTALVAGDTTLGAFQKLQGQINATNTTIGSLTTTNVSEGTRLYFTEPRVQQTLLTGLNTSLTGQIVAGDNLLQAFGRTQKQINDINTSISGNQWLTSGGNVYRSSGRVGIGTIPGGTLEVQGGTAASGDGEDIIFKAQNAGTDSVGGDIHLFTGSKNGTGTRNGRVTVGPGTSYGTPPYELTLLTSGNSYPYSIGIPDSSGFGVSLLISASSAGSNASGWSGGDVTIRGGNTYGGGGASKIVFQTAGGGTAGTFQAVTTKMTISGTGEVGIGTTSPVSKLHVAGAIKMGPDASLVCSGTTAGAMRFTTPNIEYCNGTSWLAMGLTSGSVTTTEILDGTIATADIADGAVSLVKLGGTRDATKYLKGDNTWATFASDVIGSVLSTFTVGTGTKPAITNTDTVVGAFGKVQKTLNDINADYVSKTQNQVINGTLAINSATGFITVPTPILANDAVNKSYVDGFGQWIKNGANIYFNTGNVGVGTSAPSSNLEVQITETGGFGVKDSAATGGRVFIGEGTSTANLFSPIFLGAAVGVNRSTQFLGEVKVAEDTGTTPVINFVARRDDSTSIINRVLFDWKNGTTSLMTMLANGNLGVGTNNPAQKLSVAGVIESTTGGIKFPDGTVQNTAAFGATNMNHIEYTSTFSTASTSWVDVPGFSVSITPSSSTSKILVMANVTAGMNGATTGSYRIVRDGVPIAIPTTVAGYTSVSSGSFYGGSGDGNNNETSNVNYVDTPGTTSLVTYKIQVISQQGGVLVVNGLGSDIASQIYSQRTRSSLIATENGIGAGSSQWNSSGLNLSYTTGNVGIGVANPTQKLTVAGTIESTSGGIKFPDGTTQTTASTGGQMQRGRIGTCTNNSTGTTGSVTFATAFSAIPIISVTPIELDNAGCTSVRIIAHSTTGFTWNSFVGGTGAACDCINWTAIEP